ncbi:hypothetical protein L9F63_013958, partial [Diploptera punctata]
LMTLIDFYYLLDNISFTTPNILLCIVDPHIYKEVQEETPVAENYMCLYKFGEFFSLIENLLYIIILNCSFSTLRLNSLVDSIKFLFSAYTENMIEVFKVPRQVAYNYYRMNRFLNIRSATFQFPYDTTMDQTNMAVTISVDGVFTNLFSMQYIINFVEKISSNLSQKTLPTCFEIFKLRYFDLAEYTNLKKALN